MIKRLNLKFLLTVPLLLALVLWLNGRVSQSVVAEAVRIMPLGDSITGSPGCWRANLWNQLQNNGHTNIDFVGTLPLQGCALPHDGDNEGHGGFLATNVAAQNQLVGWLAATNPDIVIMHFGTNDVWSNLSTQTILDAFTTLVGQMRSNNPNMIVLVAQIIPMDPARSCSECDQRVIALNNAIPGWAASLSSPQSPVMVVDQWTGFDTDTDTYDGVHPNDNGNQKIADAWYAALAPLLTGNGNTPTPGPSSTPVTPTAVPPTSTPGAGSCDVSFVVSNSWSNVFQANVTITNNEAAAVSGWTLNFTHAVGQTATGGWNADISQSGNVVTVSNPASHWNGTIGANGGSVTFGLQGTFTGSVVVPTDFVLNGTACNGDPLPPTPTSTATPLPPTDTPTPTATVPASCPPDLVPSMSFSAASTNLTVGDTTTLAFSTNLGIPQFTLRAEGDRIAVFPTSGTPTVYNESPLVQMINTSYPPVVQVLAPGELDLQLSVNGEAFAYSSPEQGCLLFFFFTTIADSLTLDVTEAPPTVTPTATPITGAACTVTYDIQQDWGTGFIGNVTIGVATAVSGWTLEFDFPGNQTITNMWGGLYAQSGSSVTVNNEAWNSNIPANGTAAFGFQATVSGSNDLPVDFILNGQVCD